MRSSIRIVLHGDPLEDQAWYSLWDILNIILLGAVNTWSIKRSISVLRNPCLIPSFYMLKGPLSPKGYIQKKELKQGAKMCAMVSLFNQCKWVENYVSLLLDIAEDHKTLQ